MPEPNYGNFDTMPARYDDREAWVLSDGTWKQINIAENDMTTVPYDKATYDRVFGTDLPPLPNAAFHSGG